jgi:hypothetical protein
MPDDPDPTVRAQEQLALRADRAKIYRKLREANIRVRSSRNTKTTDGFDDLFGGDGRPSTPKQSSTGSMPIATLAKAVKSCYLRLATLTAENKDVIIQSIQGTRLSRFIPETVQSLMEAKITSRDILAFVEVCSLLFQTYPDFETALEPKLREEMSSPSTIASRRCSLLSAYADLLIVRVFENSALWLATIVSLMASDIQQSKFENHPLLWRLICHCGGDVFGVDRGPESVIDPIFPSREAIGTSLRANLKGYYDAIVRTMDAKAEEGMKLLGQAADLFVQKGFTNTGQGKKADELRREHDELLKHARLYGFIMKIQPASTWKEEKPPVAEQPLQPATETPDFYSKLPDLDAAPRLLATSVKAIKDELDRTATTEGCDDAARVYVKLDTPENREELFRTVSSISKSHVNQAHFYARFVAAVSQRMPGFGDRIAEELEKGFIGYVTAQVKNVTATATQPKLHVARYLSELAKFRLGIESFFNCLNYCLNHPAEKGKTIDMMCTLFYGAGKFLDTLCDATHIRMSNCVERLKKLRDSIAFQAHVSLLLTQAVQIFEPPPEDNARIPEPAMNRYQAYLQSLFMKADQKNFSQKVRRVIEKMMMQSAVTKVDQQFLLHLILTDLPSYNVSLYQHLAKFIADFQRVSPEICLAVFDVLLERIRRGVECDKVAFRQRQICEVQFLAQLIDAGVLPFAVGFDVCCLILGLGQQNPSLFVIRVERKGHHIAIGASDFFKATLVCALLDALVLYISENPDIQDYAINLLVWLQLFCIVRSPIPPVVAFQVGDLVDRFEAQKVFAREMRFESIEAFKRFDFSRWDFSGRPYAMQELGDQARPARKIVPPPPVSDDEDYDSDNDDEDREAAFERELAELKEEFDEESRAQGQVSSKITLPVELLGTEPVAKPIATMTRFGPPKDFQVVVAKGRKNEIVPITLGGG